MTAPLIYQWSGEAMVPLPIFRKSADAAFVIGQRYRLIEAEEASSATRGHYFATLHDAWNNLPDRLVPDFPTAEVLRKHSLVMTGFRHERKFVMASPAQARWLATRLRPHDLEDDFAIISVNENVVVEWKPMSQSRKAMPTKGQFRASKDAVLGYIADLIGVKVDDLTRSNAA
jgi:hypothetical protein